jgi:peptidoglycan/LPS O-acetylase OafA/YrhL
MAYFYPLNFIRFLLALGVVLFHYGVNYFPFEEGPLRTLIVNSSFRVSFFFFISGFVMYLVYAPQQKDLAAESFYKRRSTRIFPLYWLAFVLTLLVVIFLKEASPKGLNLILHALGLQSLNPGYVLDLNYPAWSISVELVFYLLFPFLLRWLAGISWRQLGWIALLVWLLQSLQHILFVDFVYNGTKRMEEFISTFPLWHLPTFFMGMVTARLGVSGPGAALFRKRSLWFVLLSLLILGYVIFIPNPFLKYVHNGLLAPVFMLFILALYHDRSWLHRLMSNKYLSATGNLSYGLFIFQYPLWEFCVYLAGPEFSTGSRFFLIYLLALILFAALLHLYFEKPVLARLRGENRSSLRIGEAGLKIERS